MSALRQAFLGAVALAAALAATSLSVGACDDSTQVTPLDAGGEGATDAATDALPTPPRDDGSAPASPSATCASGSCPSARYEGVIDLPACCMADGACGLALVPLAGIRAVPTTCTMQSAPGVPSDECTSLVVGDDAGPSTIYQGCCRPNHACGVFVKLGGGLDLGCQAADDFVEDAGDAGSCGLDASTD